MSRFAVWRRHRVRVVVVAVAVALVVGAVIASFAIARDRPATPSQAQAPANEAQATALAYAECMREHDITDFPDPTFESDGGILFEGRRGLAASEDQLRAADEACGGRLPVAGASAGQSSDGPADVDWERIEPGGDCRCADGSDYAFFARKADPEKIVLYLDGGGACWSAPTCRPGGDNEYQRSIEEPNAEGVFAFSDQRNPFADYSVVYVPYCTADLHIGNATTRYAPDLTVQHKGLVNGTAALDYLAKNFPNATEVVVLGSSAGALTAPLYAALVSDRLPDAHITSIADSAGGYGDVPSLDAILTGGAWGATRALPEWVEEFSVPDFYVQSARHNPDILFARYDHAYDRDQLTHLELVGAPTDDLRAVIDANEAAIENAGVDVHSFTAPGERHVAFAEDAFYSENVGGIALSDWVDELVAGTPAADVHCTACRSG